MSTAGVDYHAAASALSSNSSAQSCATDKQFVVFVLLHPFPRPAMPHGIACGDWFQDWSPWLSGQWPPPSPQCVGQSSAARPYTILTSDGVDHRSLMITVFFFVGRLHGDACPSHVCCRSSQGRQVAVEPVLQWGGGGGGGSSGIITVITALKITTQTS